jgi:polar amino acid transport system ATP-binding protein
MQPVIAIKNIEKNFGKIQALKKVTIDFYRGEIIVILGPSGSGKSTLLRSLMQLEKIDSGEIIVDGLCLAGVNNAGVVAYAPKKICHEIKRKMGMILQNFPLFPHKSVLENLMASPLMAQKNNREELMAAAKKILEKIGLLEKCHAYPCELSGGQKQRVAIARALIMQPEVLLFDEPTSALDPELIHNMITIIKKLATIENKTIIITTHQLDFAAKIADRLIFMDKGEVVEIGEAKQLLNNPNSKRLRDFLGSFKNGY